MASEDMNARYLDRYGAWARRRDGAPEYDKCAAEIFSGAFQLTIQCQSPRGHGHLQSYCKQHAKKYED